MDNNMTAIVSVLMIALGVMNGLSIASLFSSEKIATLNNIISEGLDKQFNLELRIDELEKELSEERNNKQQLISQLQKLVGRHETLPPPERPIKRSRYFEEDDEDDEDEYPISPDLD